MIICPRCGYQAPDGSPWCPRCGFGCPYPTQYQQQPPQQMPVPYQPQPIPAQYDVVDIPPQPQPGPQPQRKKKKKKLPKWLKIIIIVVSIILLPFLAVVAWAIVETIKNPPVIPTNTPTMTNTATFTPEPTFTPIPSDTPVPTNTPIPTDTPVPPSNQDAAAAPYQSYSDNTYASPNTGVLGSVAQDTSGDNCNIKGNINDKGEKIYHCKNSSSYDTTEINTWAGERWFCSPEEAEAAGWRAPKNMHGCQQ